MKNKNNEINFNEIYDEEACDDSRHGGSSSSCGRVEINCDTVKIYINCND